MTVMQNALVGATGFIGGVLMEQRGFQATARSTTMRALERSEFDTVFIAAARGSMFEANKFPDRDAAHIDELVDSLSRIKARRAVLISTIAVLERFDGAFDEPAARFREDLAYGRNRRVLETSIAATFPRALIVRLPALFGAPLRKNFIFDLMNPVPSMLAEARRESLSGSLPAPLASFAEELYSYADGLGMWTLDRARLDADPRRIDLERAVIDAGAEAARFVHPDSTFQYYDLRNLSADIDKALAADLEVIHLAPAPLAAASVHERVTGRPMPASGAGVHHEDMRTAHAALFGGVGPYMAEAGAVLDDLASWVASQGGAR